MIKIGWALQNENGQWQRLDTDSGGYPYSTDMITQIHIWTDEDKINEYWRMFPKLIKCKVKMELSEIQ